MALKQTAVVMTAEEYLAGEEIAKNKHEFIDGEIYAMSGASKNHERISGTIFRKIGNFLEGSPCEPFSSDVKVKVGSDFFYPDAMVVCDDQTEDDYYTETPTIIIEVFSKSTRRYDATIKRTAYQSIPTLQEYVLIEQDFVDVEVSKKKDQWSSRHYLLGDSLILESIGLTIKVEDLYQRVQNEDMREFLISRDKP